MSGKRLGGLGRGLGSLIPTAPAPVPQHDRSAEANLTEVDQPSVEPDLAPSDPTPPADDHNDDTDRRADVPTDTRTETGTETGTDTAPGTAPDTATVPMVHLVDVPGAAFAELPIEQIHPNARQPRQVFDDDALAELTHSVREFGVLQPVVVRADDTGYELVMGERRLRAASAAGLRSIPAIIRSTTDDAMLRDALLENIHRSQLNPLEEAAAYQQLLEEFGTTHDELAQRLGRSRPQVSNTIRLLNLPVAVQRRVAAGVLSAGHARALLSLDDAAGQDELAARIVAEGLSVRATEELVALGRSAGAAKSVRRAVPRKITAPAATDLAEKLSDVLDTRVRVELGRRKGRITVEFASIDDLERIVAVMAPGLAAHRSPESPEPDDAATAGDGAAAQNEP